MNPSIEQTIDRVEQLYATITGHTPPIIEGNGSRIPPETDPVRHVEDQLGRLLAALGQQLVPETSPRAPWSPPMIAWQDDTGYELAIAMPGIARDQIELWLEPRALVVRGELPVGRVERAVALPQSVDKSDITARLEAGLLRVRITRRAGGQPSQLTIS